ncbi:hypothetical protein [Plantibacter sp. YIM 135249]|uniref:hypothetical protein n=1 Tax=Plantibacter sp. YIM 135249 TaxID=3423918 RepID=UPI003D34F459
MTGVLVEVRGDRVLVQILGNTPDGLAINPRSVFHELGTVRKVNVPGKKGFVSVWRWSSEGYSGEAGTKAKAIEAMLADVDYVETPLTATIPDLLAGLGDVP